MKLERRTETLKVSGPMSFEDIGLLVAEAIGGELAADNATAQAAWRLFARICLLLGLTL